MLRSRTALIFVLVVAFAVLLPLTSGDVSAILTPLWSIDPIVRAPAILRAALRHDTQPLSLLSRLSSRAPPASPSLA